MNIKGDEILEPDTRLFIPPVASQVLESEPVEAVNFIRDEMANMVWGIEKTIPNGLSGGIYGYETALKHVNFLKTLASEPLPVVSDNNAVIKYKLTNSVPENWIPFVPSKLSTLPLSRQIQLQRAALPRYMDGLDLERIRPKTSLLKRISTVLIGIHISFMKMKCQDQAPSLKEHGNVRVLKMVQW